MKRVKKAVIAGVIIAVVGAVVFLGAMGATGWDFSKIDNWEQDTYTANAVVSKLDVDVSAGKVVINRGDVEVVTVKYDYNETYKPEIVQNGSVLKIETPKKKNWIEFSFWFSKAPTTEITLPKDMSINQLKLTLNAGKVVLGDGYWGDLVNVKLNAGTLTVGDVQANEILVDINAGTFKATKLNCSRLTCDVSAGSAKISSLRCGDVILDVSAGSANIKFAGAQSEYNITVKKSAGSCNVSNQMGSTAKLIAIDVSAGSVTLTFDN